MQQRSKTGLLARTLQLCTKVDETQTTKYTSLMIEVSALYVWGHGTMLFITFANKPVAL